MACRRAADGSPTPPLRQLKIGDNVHYGGRVYVLRGMDPMSVPDREALLEDPSSGELVRVPFDEVHPATEGRAFDSEGLG